MGPTQIGIYERMIDDDVVEYRKKVIEVLERNGIEGRFPRSVKNCLYDNRIERVIRSNTNTTPLDFVKQLLLDELL